MSAQSVLAFPVTDKENAPDAHPNVKNPRKRTITTANGEDVDLSKEFSASATVIEAMRQRIFQLEDLLESATKEPPAKRARTTESSTVATAASTKADTKKIKVQLKKIFDRIKKECKSETCKFQGASKSVKVDEVFEPSEFETIFGGKGTLIQPTPTNKPKSTVTIITFTSQQVKDFFGDEYKDLKGFSWTRGGGPSFSKSVKLGQVDVNVDSMEVNYAKNTLKCTLKLEVSSPDSCGGIGPSGISRRGMWSLF